METINLTPDELQRIVTLVESETVRLRELLAQYEQTTVTTRNPVVREMAEEGARCVREKVAGTRDLLGRLQDQSHG